MSRVIEGELVHLARRITQLVDAGWQEVVIVTDHGWLLLPGGLPKVSLPEHQTVVRKGRCARLTEAAQPGMQTVPWYWDRSVAIAMAPGIGCFEAGRDYEHGGLSLQECVIPVVTVGSATPALATVSIEAITWTRLRCNVTLSGVSAPVAVDLRTRAGDPGSSLLVEARTVKQDGSVALYVEDEDQEGSAALVVVLDAAGGILAQRATAVGGGE